MSSANTATRMVARVAFSLVAFALLSVGPIRQAAATIDGNNFFIYPVQDQQTGGVQVYLKGAAFDGYGSMPLNAALQQAFGAVTTKAIGAYTMRDGKLVSSPRQNVNAVRGVKIQASEPKFDKRTMTVSATLDVRPVVREINRGRLSRAEGLSRIRAAVVSAIGTARLYSNYAKKASMMLKVKGMDGLSWKGSAGIRVPANPRKAYDLKKPDRRERSFRHQSMKPAWD